MVIYIEIESTARELHYKIMLATLLAKRGHRVIIAQSDILRKIYRKGKGGVYLGKNIFTRPAKEESGKYLLEQRYLGIQTVYLDEEGAVLSGEMNDWRHQSLMRYNRNFFKPDDIVLYWGDYWKEQDNNVLGRQITVGAPSFDLFRRGYNELFDIVTQENKTNILVNGNFSAILAPNGMNTLEIIDMAGHIEDQNLMLKILSGEMNSYSLLLGFIVKLSSKYKSDKYNIVYRPHPGETHDFTNALLSKFENVSVENRKPLEIAIREADYVLHDGCTTGIQAHIAEKKVVAIQDSEFPRIYIPNAVSNVAKSIKDMEEFVVRSEEGLSNCINSDYPPLESLISNIKADSEQAILKIVDILDDACRSINKRNYREPTKLDVMQVDFLFGASIKIKKKTLYKVDHNRAHRFAYDTKRWIWDKEYIKSYQKKCSKFITSNASISYMGDWSLIIE